MNSYLYFKIILLHIIIGFLVFQFKVLANVFFIGMNIYFLYKIYSSPKKRTFYVLLICAYTVGIEVFLRMNNGSFLYEASKYLVILYMLIGLSKSQFHINANIYIVYLIFLIPGIFIAATTLGFDTNIRKAIAFNLSGPVCLGICAVFCYKRNVTIKQMKYILLAFIFPLVSTTTYLFLYTPDIRSVITGTGSNFQASGGFGPNQMATILGLGVFAFTARFFMHSKTDLWNKALDLILLGLISFRALVTLSRGGVVTALLMIICFIFLYYFSANLKKKSSIRGAVVLLLILASITWGLSSISTNGFIDKRYTNKNAAGVEKTDISTGRARLISYEFDAFRQNPFLGIGVGKVKESRIEDTGIHAASHNEMTRILAEHGLFGLFAFLILLLTPLVNRLSNKKNIFFYSFYFFWLLTINHSAMRLAAPAFIYGLCLLNVKYEKPIIHRKPAIR